VEWSNQAQNCFRESRGYGTALSPVNVNTHGNRRIWPKACLTATEHPGDAKSRLESSGNSGKIPSLRSVASDLRQATHDQLQLAQTLMNASPQPEKHEFQTEVQQLLQLMIHSLYSDKEIFRTHPMRATSSDSMR